MQAELCRERKLGGMFQLIRSIEFDLDFDRLDRWPPQAQGIDTRPVLSPLHRLGLQRAGERVRVVLQRNDAPHGRGIRIHGDDAAFDQAGRNGRRAHTSLGLALTLSISVLQCMAKTSSRRRFSLKRLLPFFFYFARFSRPVRTARASAGALSLEVLDWGQLKRGKISPYICDVFGQVAAWPLEPGHDF